MSFRKFAPVALVGLAVFFTPLHSKAVSHPEVVIEGQGLSLTTPGLGEARRHTHRVMGGASVVDSNKTKEGRASTLHDALSFVPGVYVQSRQGSEESRLSIRGSGLQRTFHGRGLRLLQDGVPLNLADGGFDFQAVEPLSSRYIEVYRGANALEFGSASLGGAVNYVSHTGHTATPFQARFEAGSFGYLRGQLSSGQAYDSSDYYASLSEFYQEGFREHSRQNTQRVFGNIGKKIGERTENRTFVTFVHTDSELPGSLTKAELNRDPEMANPANISGDQKRDFDLFRLSNKTAHAWGASQLDLNAYYAWKHLDHPIFQVIDQVSHDAGIGVTYTDKADRAGRRNRLVAGVAPSIGLVNDERYVNVNGGRGSRTGDSDQTATNLDVFIENQHYVMPKLALAVGAQYGYAVRKNEDKIPVSPGNPDNSDEQTYSAISPKLGARYEISSRSQVYANVSRSFEPPTFGELVGNNTNGGLVKLDEQTATTVELGTRGDGETAVWDVSYYRAWIKDELLSLTDAAGNALGTVNADETIHQGVEFGLDLQLLSGLFSRGDRNDRVLLRQAYTWSDFSFDGDPVFGDKQLAGAPEHFYRGEVKYEHPGGFYAGPNVEWVPSKFPIDHQNTFFADSYTLLGFKAGYKTKKGISLFIDGRNLTDETYAATTGVVANANGADSRQFMPGDGRSFYTGVELSF